MNSQDGVKYDKSTNGCHFDKWHRIRGGYAEYAVAPEGQCMRIPKNVSIIEAAGIPEVFCTVWANMIDRCALKANETVLIQGH